MQSSAAAAVVAAAACRSRVPAIIIIDHPPRSSSSNSSIVAKKCPTCAVRALPARRLLKFTPALGKGARARACTRKIAREKKRERHFLDPRQHDTSSLYSSRETSMRAPTRARQRKESCRAPCDCVTGHYSHFGTLGACHSVHTPAPRLAYKFYPRDEREERQRRASYLDIGAVSEIRGPSSRKRADASLRASIRRVYKKITTTTMRRERERGPRGMIHPHEEAADLASCFLDNILGIVQPLTHKHSGHSLNSIFDDFDEQQEKWIAESDKRFEEAIKKLIEALKNKRQPKEKPQVVEEVKEPEEVKVVEQPEVVEEVKEPEVVQEVKEPEPVEEVQEPHLVEEVKPELWRSPRGTTLYIIPNAIWCLFDSRMAPRAIQNLPRHQSRPACAAQAQETSLAPRRTASALYVYKTYREFLSARKTKRGLDVDLVRSVLPCRNSPSGVRPCITLNVPCRVQRVTSRLPRVSVPQRGKKTSGRIIRSSHPMAIVSETKLQSPFCVGQVQQRQQQQQHPTEQALKLSPLAR
ncbi:unnamed protein product [Trichogramma brassicae]|uniref:Uncharacterized protein n=1 Tax=Trichogramma brassicae TaxID=86971 RepID=A0A6H5IVX1_9HYME|nr:unnamed protein product [Trichogramma brassicae]